MPHCQETWPLNLIEGPAMISTASLLQQDYSDLVSVKAYVGQHREAEET